MHIKFSSTEPLVTLLADINIHEQSMNRQRVRHPAPGCRPCLSCSQHSKQLLPILTTGQAGHDISNCPRHCPTVSVVGRQIGSGATIKDHHLALTAENSSHVRVLS